MTLLISTQSPTPYLKNELVAAYSANDDSAFDRAYAARERNDLAHFLFLFTRLEAAIHAAFDDLLHNVSAEPWRDTRAWLIWQSRDRRNRADLMIKAELLLEKGRSDCEDIREYYGHRNLIAHGEIWAQSFVMALVAQRMHDIVATFATT